MLTYEGLRQAAADLPGGRPAVLVDERYGEAVIEAARRNGTTLAVPVERSGRQEFEREYGADWLVHVQGSGAAYAKVLVRRRRRGRPGGRPPRALALARAR